MGLSASSVPLPRLGSALGDSYSSSNLFSSFSFCTSPPGTQWIIVTDSSYRLGFSSYQEPETLSFYSFSQITWFDHSILKLLPSVLAQDTEKLKLKKKNQRENTSEFLPEIGQDVYLCVQHVLHLTTTVIPWERLRWNKCCHCLFSLSGNAIKPLLQRWKIRPNTGNSINTE